MCKMLLQYFFRNMEGKLLAIPLFFFLYYIGIFLLFERSSLAFSSGLIASVSIFTILFLHFYQNSKKMFDVMPIPKKELVQAKFIFLLYVAGVYVVLFNILHALIIHFREESEWSGWMETVGTTLLIILLVVNLLLFLDFLPNQKVASMMIPLLLSGIACILFLSPLHRLPTGEMFSTGGMLATAISTAFLMTWLHYRIIIYLTIKLDIL